MAMAKCFNKCAIYIVLWLKKRFITCNYFVKKFYNVLRKTTRKILNKNNQSDHKLVVASTEIVTKPLKGFTNKKCNFII